MYKLVNCFNDLFYILQWCQVLLYNTYIYFQSEILEALGATVERVRPVSITHKDHYVNIARRRALEANKLALQHINKTDAKHATNTNGYLSDKGEHDAVNSSEYKGGFFADQFENLANYRAHYERTGPEIWEQTGGKLHAFIAAAGTGGTVAGVSRFLKVTPFPKRKKEGQRA